MDYLKPDYIPGTGDEFRRWLGNFITGLRANAAQLNVAAADVERLAEKAAGLEHIQSVLTLYKQIHMSYSAVERLFVEGLEDIEVTLPTLAVPPAGGELKGGLHALIVRLVEAVKHSPNYSEKVGVELGILPRQMDLDASVEIGPYKFKDGVLLVAWRRGHPFTAVEFFLDNGNTRGFQSLGIDHHPPVAIWDKLPHQGGLVRIKAQGYLDNRPFGALSEVLEISVPVFMVRSR
jgi:hypothetical protein